MPTAPSKPAASAPVGRGAPATEVDELGVELLAEFTPADPVTEEVEPVMDMEEVAEVVPDPVVVARAVSLAERESIAAAAVASPSKPE